MHEHRTKPRRRPVVALGAASALAVTAGACGFEALEAAPDRPAEIADVEGAVIVDDIVVAPGVIHPGDEVVLRDAIVPAPDDPVAVYFWDVCAGAIVARSPFGREVTWRAPDAPGLYAVTMNITHASRDVASRAIVLCVVDETGAPCGAAPASPRLLSLDASPSRLEQPDCDGACETDLVVRAEGLDPGALEYRWTAGSGAITGAGATVRWRLPGLGCCTETFTAALTVCDGPTAAATGFTNVTVIP